MAGVTTVVSAYVGAHRESQRHGLGLMALVDKYDFFYILEMRLSVLGEISFRRSETLLHAGVGDSQGIT